ncbi:MAG: site-specific integrase [Acidimicrobiales bacterium]
MKQGSIQGSVVKVAATGNWRARYRNASGRVTSRNFKLKGHAQNWLREELDAMHSGAPVVNDHVKFDVYVEKWMKRVALDVRTTTFETYSTYYRVHINPMLGDVEFRDLTSEAVRDWYDKLRTTNRHGKEQSPALSRATCAKTYKLLKRICADAVDDGYLLSNPCRIKGASAEPDYRLSYEEPPDADEVRALAAAVPKDYRAMVLLAGFGGLRWGECAGLQRRHVEIQAGTVRIEQQVTRGIKGEPTISVPKTDAGRRTVHLHGEVVAALRLHLADHVGGGANAYLFTTEHGALLRANNFTRRVWKPAVTAVGKPDRRFHDLRHAAATFAALTGATTKDLMARMGHRSQVAANPVPARHAGTAGSHRKRPGRVAGAAG